VGDGRELTIEWEFELRKDSEEGSGNGEKKRNSCRPFIHFPNSVSIGQGPLSGGQSRTGKVVAYRASTMPYRATVGHGNATVARYAPEVAQVARDAK